MKKYYKVLFFLTVFFVKNSFGAQGTQVFKFSENSAFRNLNNQEKSLYTGDSLTQTDLDIESKIIDSLLKKVLSSNDSLLSHDKSLDCEIAKTEKKLSARGKQTLSNRLECLVEGAKERDVLIKDEKNDRFKLHIEFLKRLQYCQD